MAADFSVHLLRNDGRGNLAAPREVFDQAWRPENLVFSDMDGDGQEDILVMDEDRAAFAGNAGGGRFDQLSYFLCEESLPGFAPGIFFPADIDNSGGRDIVIAHADSTRISILLAGDEPFVTSAILDPGFVAEDMAAADLDGDDTWTHRRVESHGAAQRSNRPPDVAGSAWAAGADAGYDRSGQLGATLFRIGGFRWGRGS